MSDMSHKDGKLNINLNDKDAFELFMVEHAEGVPVLKIRGFFRRRLLQKFGLLTIRKSSGRKMHVLTPLGRQYMSQLKQKIEAEIQSEENQFGL